MKIIPTDVYENGDLIRIEFYDLQGNRIVDAVWDENDPQDSEHREAFRLWSYRVVGQLDDGKFQVLV
jgi:hypothetical protein